jgi:hypothetical protein
MTEHKPYAPMSDFMGCFAQGYSLIGTVYGAALYLVVALELFLRGDLCSLLAWICVLGPLCATFGAALWPFALCSWPFG